MMALAALSMASQDGKERLDALQHYQQALPALQSTLKSAEDLSSDGAFLTHFLLLVYEVRTFDSSIIFAYLPRFLQPKPATTTSGHSIFLRYFESLFCDAKSLAANDTPLSFGGSA